MVPGKQNKKEMGYGNIGKMKKAAILFAIMMISASLLLAGCTIQENAGNIVADGNDGGPEEGVPENKVDIDYDAKPEAEKNQEMIEAFIADGNYEKNVTYDYHSGTEEVNIKITVKDNVITDASVEGINSHKTSAKYIAEFNAALPEMVIGKRIDELNLPKQVGGSSLTNAAFQEYVKGLQN